MKKKRRLGAGDAEPKKKRNGKHVPSSEITEPTQPHFLSVYDGQTCIGFLLTRGRRGVEAFTADNKSLGVFVDQRTAADALGKAAAP